METADIAPSTPITSRADRTDERVRLIEEAVLLIRGEWPAVASGLCESVNRAAGLIFRSSELPEAIQKTSEEAVRVVDRLYGHDATLEVQRLAAVSREPEAHSAVHGTAHRPRVRLHPRPHWRVRARVG